MTFPEILELYDKLRIAADETERARLIVNAFEMGAVLFLAWRLLGHA